MMDSVARSLYTTLKTLTRVSTTSMMVTTQFSSVFVTRHSIHLFCFLTESTVITLADWYHSKAKGIVFGYVLAYSEPRVSQS